MVIVNSISFMKHSFRFKINKWLLLCYLLFITSCGEKQNNNIHHQENNKETKKVVIALYGMPACGKLTLATELSKKYNLYLVDNHLFNNVIFPFIEVNNQNVISVYPDIIKIKELWLKNIINYGKKDKGFVFTDVFLDIPACRKDVENMKNFAEQLGFKWMPVKLMCSEDAIKQRINTEQRKAKFKLVDFKVWKDYVDNTKFLDVENSLVIDNVDLEKTLQIIDDEVNK